MNFIYWNCGMKTLLMQLRKERLEKKQACRDLSPDLCYTGKCGALTNWVSRPLGRGGGGGWVGKKRNLGEGGWGKKQMPWTLFFILSGLRTLVPEFFFSFFPSLELYQTVRTVISTWVCRGRISGARVFYELKRKLSCALDLKHAIYMVAHKDLFSGQLLQEFGETNCQWITIKTSIVSSMRVAA